MKARRQNLRVVVGGAALNLIDAMRLRDELDAAIAELSKVMDVRLLPGGGWDPERDR